MVFCAASHRDAPLSCGSYNQALSSVRSAQERMTRLGVPYLPAPGGEVASSAMGGPKPGGLAPGHACASRTALARY